MKVNQTSICKRRTDSDFISDIQVEASKSLINITSSRVQLQACINTNKRHLPEQKENTEEVSTSPATKQAIHSMRALMPAKKQVNPKKIMLPIEEDNEGISIDSDTTLIKAVFKQAHRALKPIKFDDHSLQSTMTSRRKL